MTDDQTEDAAVAAEVAETGTTVVGAVANDTGVQAAGALVTDYDNAVLLATYSDDEAAYSAYEALQDLDMIGDVRLDGVLVVKTDADGMVKIQKMTDHSTKTGVKWGAVGGLVLGIFFPPAIIASTVGVGVVGGVLGKIRNEWHKSEVGDSLMGALGPSQSGILALVDTGDVTAVQAAMPPPTSVRTAGVDNATAKQIADAAKQAS
jgi:uncharacterized membrane protein